ncbi:hypothetical protein [Miltoncostaea oceani]|uniref:hypothetical protein n=1 Tax=Miltoncostaea oceani TaxID=2843216 RepID=UPI001C3C51F5|nr:hypothetical protein [Miltoncostaea oceani]
MDAEPRSPAMPGRARRAAVLLVAVLLPGLALAHSPAPPAGPDDVSAAVARVEGTAEAHTRALGWIEGQQDRSQGYAVTFDEAYGVDHVGPVAGRVADVGDLAPVPPPAPVRVAFDRSYDEGHAGPLSGTWAGVDPLAYVVEVAARDGGAPSRHPLEPDGSWTTAPAAAPPGGAWVARLTRTADGAVVATAESPGPPVDGVAVHVFSRTDIDNLQAVVPLRRDGTFRAPLARRGVKIARLVRTGDDRILNSSEWTGAPGIRGLPRSFQIPRDDPDYGYSGDETRRSGYRLEQRSFVYDAAVASLALTAAGRHDRAADILERLAALQGADGALAFSYDVFLGREADRYVRSGALAWVGTAAVEYELATGDRRFRPLAQGLARYLLGRQVTRENGFAADDPRYGSVRGGEGRYGPGYEYIPEEIAWVSTEHNIDAYFFLRDLGYVLGDARLAEAAQAVKRSLLTNHWDAERERFDQGVGDTARALDLVSWGGLFLRAIGRDDLARRQIAHLGEFVPPRAPVALSADPETYNRTYTTSEPIGGYQPYAGSPGTYDDPPATVWGEGTWGAILLRLRLGLEAGHEITDMLRLQAADARGGLLQVTAGRRSPPYEFHVWPALGGTAWAAIVLGGSEVLWRTDGWAGQAVTRHPGPTLGTSAHGSMAALPDRPDPPPRTVATPLRRPVVTSPRRPGTSGPRRGVLSRPRWVVATRRSRALRRPRLPAPPRRAPPSPSRPAGR